VKYASIIRVLCSMVDESVTILLVVAMFIDLVRGGGSVSTREICVEIG
jgi:hypothetical protein